MFVEKYNRLIRVAQSNPNLGINFNLFNKRYLEINELSFEPLINSKIMKMSLNREPFVLWNNNNYPHQSISLGLVGTKNKEKSESKSINYKMMVEEKMDDGRFQISLYKKGATKPLGSSILQTKTLEIYKKYFNQEYVSLENSQLIFKNIENLLGKIKNKGDKPSIKDIISRNSKGLKILIPIKIQELHP